MDLTRRLYTPTSEMNGKTDDVKASVRETSLAVALYRPDMSKVSIYHPGLSDSHTGICSNTDGEQAFRHGDKLAD